MEPVLPPAPVKLWNLSELAPPPDWEKLEAWQETMTAAQFRHLLENVMTEGTAFWSTVEQLEDRALIRTSTARVGAPRFEFRFARESSAPSHVLAPRAGTQKPAARYWRKASEMGPAPSPERPLEGVRIALDPGHNGGKWAKMEGRWFQVGLGKAVMEGELTLQVARLLRPMLEKLGAVVTLVRDSNEALTSTKPEDLMDTARESLVRSLGAATVPAEWQVKREAERLVYRTSEIRTRGNRVNLVLKPDLLVCLHFNAEGWGGDANNPAFSKMNHLHLITHGCLGRDEFMLDDQRLDALLRMVQGIPDEELRLCDAVARHMAEATGLPAYTYNKNTARRVNDNPYVWARNLLANRVYHCPVVFPEPYVMNNQEVYDRVQAGDYEGEKEVAGKVRRSIFREYAQSVADGLAEGVGKARS